MELSKLLDNLNNYSLEDYQKISNNKIKLIKDKIISNYINYDNLKNKYVLLFKNSKFYKKNNKNSYKKRILDKFLNNLKIIEGYDIELELSNKKQIRIWDIGINNIVLHYEFIINYCRKYESIKECPNNAEQFVSYTKTKNQNIYWIYNQKKYDVSNVANIIYKLPQITKNGNALVSFKGIFIKKELEILLLSILILDDTISDHLLEEITQFSKYL